MPEIPKHAKFIAETPRKKKEAANNIEELKKQAIAVLVEQYKELKQEAIDKKDSDILDQADKLLDRIREIHEDKNPLIDDLEAIIGSETIEISGKYEGREIKFELKKQLEDWAEFYQKHNIDWIEMPETIRLTPEQEKEIIRLIEQFGFDKMIIIPENIADTGDKMEKLHKEMTEGEEYEDSFQSSNFQEDGGFPALAIGNNLKIILTKNIQELDDDKLHKETLGKSIDDLEAPGGIFQKNQLQGLDLTSYLIYQREYFESNKKEKHLDDNRLTWLPGSRFSSGRIPGAGWDSHDSQLYFDANTSGGRYSYLGCRLSGSLDIL